MRWSAFSCQFVEYFTEGGDTLAERIEIALGNKQDFHSGAGLDGGVARFIGKERHLAEIAARTKLVDENLAPAGGIDQHIDLALQQDIELIARFTLTDDTGVARIDHRLDALRHFGQLILG